MPKGLLEEVKEHLDHMLDIGAITPSNSAWSNAVVLVQRKDGGLQFCIDFRKLNACTKKDAYPLPHIHEAINALCESRYYTTVDLLSGFWQTPMAKDQEVYCLHHRNVRLLPVQMHAIRPVQCTSNIPASDAKLLGRVKLCHMPCVPG